MIMMNRQDRKKRIANAKLRAHHLWSLHSSEDRLGVKRNKMDDDLMEDKYNDEVPKEAMKRIRNKRADSDVSRDDINAVYWGLFGASLVDDKTLSSSIPMSIVNRFNATNGVSSEVPNIYGWDKLIAAFGEENIKSLKKDVSFGIQTRMASKYLNIPFLAAADIIYGMDNVDHDQVKKVIGMIRDGEKKNAVRKYGVLAIRIARIYDKYKDPDNRRIAIDRSAKDYWESYLGPFGKEMVREVKKRVRADLAKAWLRKHGVDNAAAEYWSKYYGEYGEQWVSVVPKMISPAK